MAGLVKGKNIDVSQVSFAPPKVLDNGAKLVYVNHRGNRFIVQTPEIEFAWDLSCYDEGAYPKYSAEMSFRGMDTNPEIKSFHDKFIELEQHIIKGGVENGSSWLKLPTKQCTEDIVSSKFGPIIKPSKDKETGEPDGKWPSTMKLKVPYRDGKFDCKFFRKNGEAINVNGDNEDDHLDNVIVKGAKAKCIIRCVGLWCAAGNFMCQWQLERCEVDVPERDSACAFLPDSDCEEDNNESVNDGPRMLEDSDEEPEPELEPEPETEKQPAPKLSPKPAPKKKLLKKKTGGN
jgi:hypothetical protein